MSYWNDVYALEAKGEPEFPSSLDFSMAVLIQKLRIAGVDFYFVIPKSEITLLPKKGYSYVPVEINGEKYCFNVSGGSFNGWTDTVRRTTHVGIGCKLKTLKSLAAVALSVEEVKHRGITLDLHELDFRQQAQFTEKVASYDVRKRLKAGDKVVLEGGRDFNGKRADFYILAQKTLHRFIVWLDDHKSIRGRLSRQDIYYTKTAELNGWPTVSASGFNKIGDIVPYHLRKKAV